jgi:hypothetical protein
MRKLRVVAAAAVVLLAAVANAGPLVSATYIQSIQGATLVLGTPLGGTPTGTLVGNTFSLNAGSAFALSVCIGNPGNPSCIANPAGPFAPPVTRININFTNNGPLVGTTADPTITAPSGIMGLVKVLAKIGKAPSFTLLPIVVNAGAGGNLTTPPIPTPTSYTTPPSLRVYLQGDVWHLGAITQTALTTMFGALPDVMATGNVSVTTMSGNSFTNVNLVSLSRTKIRGLANSDTTAPSYLLLKYFNGPVPEPGTLALLGAGVAGLVLIGRRKLR